MRILLLAVMGLGAMYMMHLLAMDFNRIRRPLTNVVRSLIFKRDLTAQQRNPVMLDDIEVNWQRVLQNDPLQCARSLICEISAGNEDHNKEAQHIFAFVQYSIRQGNAPEQIEDAFKLGLEKRQQPEKHCYATYPHCPYSAKTMLKILDVHAYWFGGK